MMGFWSTGVVGRKSGENILYSSPSRCELVLNKVKEDKFTDHSLAQTPGPDLACQDMVMESEAFISSENSCISTSRRARAGQYSNWGEAPSSSPIIKSPY